jgi:hypothetical protein
MQLALQTIIRKATIAEVMDGILPAFDLKGTTFVYDASYAELLLDGVKGSPNLDRVFFKAAAVVLAATGGIPDRKLRAYVCDRLHTGLPILSKRGRGRTSKDHWGRDVAIIHLLIVPLLDRFNATRNRENKRTESACSITQKALARVGIHMTEERVVEIWRKRPRMYRTK